MCEFFFSYGSFFVLFQTVNILKLCRQIPFKIHQMLKLILNGMLYLCISYSTMVHSIVLYCPLPPPSKKLLTFMVNEFKVFVKTMFLSGLEQNKFKKFHFRLSAMKQKSKRQKPAGKDVSQNDVTKRLQIQISAAEKKLADQVLKVRISILDK